MTNVTSIPPPSTKFIFVPFSWSEMGSTSKYFCILCFFVALIKCYIANTAASGAVPDSNGMASNVKLENRKWEEGVVHFQFCDKAEYDTLKKN
eukprot:15365767-Ditylum_brightwellii.AAC.1